MLTSTKIKWLGSITLAGILVILALMGGDWGKDFKANASEAPLPVITRLIPDRMPVRSPDKVIVVEGYIPGNEHDTAVRFSGSYFDDMLHPPEVYEFGTSVNVTDTLMTEATVYTVTVVISRWPPPDGPTIPHLPITMYDDVSNVLTFTIFPVNEFFLPVISKKP